MDVCGLNDSFHFAHGMNKLKGVSIYGLTAWTSSWKLMAMMLSWLCNARYFLEECTRMQVMVISITVTAFLWCVCVLQLQVSHLSYGNCAQSRVCKLRKRRSAVEPQKQLMAVVLLCGVASAKAMDEQSGPQEAFLQHMTSMAEAATPAAAAAERALKRSSTSTGSNEGLSAASRILKAPDVFSGQDAMFFQQWKHQFTNWLCFGDGRYFEALNNLEKKSEAPPSSSYNADEIQMSQKWFAVPTSYLEASGGVYPKELMAATLIRCRQPKPREQFQLSITDDTSYRDIRDKITAYERVVKTWTSDQALKHVNDQPSYTSGTQSDGPVLMEVDRVEKGKCKQKGKGKNKGFSGGGWASGWLYGRGRGPGRSNKGKGKGKSKGESKGKKVVPRKVAPKERRLAAERLHTANVQIVWSMTIGPRIARTWSMKLQADKNHLLQTQLPLLLSRQPNARIPVRVRFTATVHEGPGKRKTRITDIQSPLFRQNCTKNCSCDSHCCTFRAARSHGE